MPAFDTIVVGLGAVGSACTLQLARRGQRVLGLDRHSLPHDQGSSHGETRITRCAVGEGTAYVPLVQRSHEIWRELEQDTGLSLLTQCGTLILANGTAAQVHGKTDFVGRTIAAAEQYGIPHERLDARAIAARFPQFRMRGDEQGCFEPGGGFVRPELCIQAQLTAAARAGAALLTGAQVIAIEQDGSGARVVLADSTVHRAGEVVLAAGAWTAGLAAGVAPHLAVTRQVLHWFEADHDAFAPERCPVYIWVHGDGPEDTFYGFPSLGPGQGVKVATEQYASVTSDPDHVQRDVSPNEAATMHAVHLATRMPGLQPRALRSKACLYTMTPDGDFLLDRAPGNPRVLVVSACSGHGFKHSAGLGDAVAGLLCGQPGTADLASFGLGRLLRQMETLTA